MKIFKVNGERVEGATHAQVVNLIRQGGDSLSLTVIIGLKNLIDLNFCSYYLYHQGKLHGWIQTMTNFMITLIGHQWTLKFPHIHIRRITVLFNFMFILMTSSSHFGEFFKINCDFQTNFTF